MTRISYFPRALLAVLLSSVLLMPTAAAAETTGTIEATTVGAQGEARTSGALTAALQPLAPPRQLPSSAFVVVTADNVRIETDYGPAVRAEGLIWQVVGPDTDSQQYGPATIASSDLREGYRFDVLPRASGATFTVNTACAQLRTPITDSVTREPFVQSDEERSDWHIAPTGTQWQDCTTAAPVATIEGDFVFSAWEVDFTLEADGQSHRLSSGHGKSAYSPHAASDAYVREDRELYVYVTNGTMQLSLARGSEYAVFLGDETTLAVHGSLYLEQASGALQLGDDVVGVEDEAVSLHGDVLLQGQESGTWHVGGDIHDASINGQAVATTIVAPPSANAWWIVGALVMAAGAVALVWWHGRPRRVYARVWSVDGIQVSQVPETRREERGAGHWLLSYAASKVDRHRSSLRHAKRACKLFAMPEALAQRGYARRRVGDARGAIVDLTLAHEGLAAPAARADVCVEAAKALIQEDRCQDAVDWLRDGFEDDPLHVMAALRRRDFDAIRDDAWVRSVEAGVAVRQWGGDHSPDVA